MSSENLYLQKPWLSFYPEHLSPQPDIPTGDIPQLFEQSVQKYQHTPALRYYGAALSYEQLNQQANQFAHVLQNQGVGPGDTVALCLVNCPQYPICYLGALKVGARITPVSPLYTSHELQHQLSDSQAKLIVCQDILYEHIAACDLDGIHVIITPVDAYLPKIKKLWSRWRQKSHKATKTAKASQSWPDLQSLMNQHSTHFDAISVDPQQHLASLSYTGGTTAQPKAAALTHHNMISCAFQTQQFLDDLNPGQETVVAYLPLFHIYGQAVIMLNSLLQGYTLVLLTTPDMDHILNAIERYRSSMFFGVPTMFEYLKEYERTDFVHWNHLKYIVSGADSLHQSTLQGWKRRTQTTILEGYGMTEVAGACHFNPKHRIKEGSFGVPLPGMDSAILDPDGDTFLPVGEIGEIVVSGSNLMQEYWNRPEETQKAFVELCGKRWYRTGDLGKMDDEGYFHFFDRKRDIIKYKGYAVFARHVEEVLYQHPHIKAAGVLGVPDPKAGQLIKAYVVLQPDARGKLSESEIQDYCREHLAYYKVPQIIEFRGELPKTDVGKVSKRELQEEPSV